MRRGEERAITREGRGGRDATKAEQRGVNGDKSRSTKHVEIGK